MLTGLIIMILWVGVMCALNYWCETAPTIEEAGYGYGYACFMCNLGNNDCKKCAVRDQYLKTGQWVK